MAFGGNISIDQAGLRGVMSALDDLLPQLRKSAETAVLRAGAAPIRKAARANAAKCKDSGLLRKSIGLNIATVRGEKSARIGPQKGLRQKVTRTDKRTGKKREEIADPNNYSHLVEFGTSHSSAQPFIRPAIDSAQGQTLNAMTAGLDKHLTRVAARLAKK